MLSRQGNGTTMRLVDALEMLGLQAEISLAGRWITLQGERARVYVVEGSWGGDYYTWCDDERARSVECYRDPIEAIQHGLRRAARTQPSRGDQRDVMPEPSDPSSRG